MDHTQEALFDPGTHEHVYRRTRGPYETHELITTPNGARWCWSCISWVTEYRDGRWLNRDEMREAGFTYRDEMRNS